MIPTLGSNVTNYTFYVPYEISGGTIYAELNDATALFDGQAAGEDYSSNVSGFAVGAGNVYSIGTASAKGTPKIYTITIKRLSNDASLQSITFTNGVGLDNFAPTRYSYETSVPYSISSTTVTATATNSNASVITGNGSWTFNILESDGTNNRTITVPSVFASSGIGIQGEVGVETIFFQIDRYFDTIDLSTTNIQILYKTKEDSVIEDIFMKEIVDKKLIFGWSIPKQVTNTSGKIKIAIRFIKTDNDQIIYNFSTLPTEISVKPGLSLTDFTTGNNRDFVLERFEITSLANENP